MSRRDRERALLEIVAEEAISTQAELVEGLARRGIEVTQATVSRDVKRLGLVKLPGPGGTYRYAPPDAEPAAPPAARETLRDAVREFVTGVDEAQGILVLWTPPGYANAVAIALDDAALPGVVATLAGDDTIFVLARTAAERGRVRRRLEGWLT